MAEPSFNELLVLVFGVGLFLMWVVSDVLEEQMLGRTRRDRQKAVKVRERAATRRAPPPRTHAVQLPRAQVHRRRDMHAA